MTLKNPQKPTPHVWSHCLVWVNSITYVIIGVKTAVGIAESRLGYNKVYFSWYYVKLASLVELELFKKHSVAVVAVGSLNMYAAKSLPLWPATNAIPVHVIILPYPCLYNLQPSCSPIKQLKCRLQRRSSSYSRLLFFFFFNPSHFLPLFRELVFNGDFYRVKRKNWYIYVFFFFFFILSDSLLFLRSCRRIFKRTILNIYNILIIH